MDDAFRAGEISAVLAAIDRLDSLADTAELMGDDTIAARLRDEADRCRHGAMGLLDG